MTLHRFSTTARPICLPHLRQELLDHYLDCLAGFIDLNRDAFMEHYYAFVYVRILQALGAYGFRGFYERKAHFLQSVPYALKNLRWLAEHVRLPIALPALLDALQECRPAKNCDKLPRPPRVWSSTSSAFPSIMPCPPMNPAMVEDSSSMPAACLILAVKSNTAHSPAATPPSSTISIASRASTSFSLTPPRLSMPASPTIVSAASPT